MYCFARKTHSYLDLDTGLGFDSQIVVKVNAPELLRRQLGSRRWTGDHIAMGTNVDCYQRAKGRYRLMPGILLTKGTLILRDLDLLRQAAAVTESASRSRSASPTRTCGAPSSRAHPPRSGAWTSYGRWASTALGAGC